jgi:hypothetical protein
VTFGVVVVVVGGVVVVVVVGAAVVGVAVVGVAVAGVVAFDFWVGAVVVVAGADVVVDDEVVVDAAGLDVVDVVVDASDALAAPLDPGCSRATTTPIKADAPVAESTAARVRRRSRSCALSRVSGVCPRWDGVIGTFSLGVPPIRPWRFRHERKPRCVLAVTFRTPPLCPTTSTRNGHTPVPSPRQRG